MPSLAGLEMEHWSPITLSLLSGTSWRTQSMLKHVDRLSKQTWSQWEEKLSPKPNREESGKENGMASKEGHYERRLEGRRAVRLSSPFGIGSVAANVAIVRQMTPTPKFCYLSTCSNSIRVLLAVLKSENSILNEPYLTECWANNV